MVNSIKSGMTVRLGRKTDVKRINKNPFKQSVRKTAEKPYDFREKHHFLGKYLLVSRKQPNIRLFLRKLNLARDKSVNLC